MKKIVVIIIFSVLILSNSSWSEEVTCNGYNSETNAWVWGTCFEGSFNGYDSETNAYVWGSCDF